MKRQQNWTTDTHPGITFVQEYDDTDDPIVFICHHVLQKGGR